MLYFAITAISLALVFYTIGVWGEKIKKDLKKSHLILFWLGFVFDTTGTTLMTALAGSGFIFNFHGITVMIAILLMLFHAVWATVVLLQNNPVKKQIFHKFSIGVWIIWLVPYLSGMIIGLMQP